MTTYCTGCHTPHPTDSHYYIKLELPVGWARITIQTGTRTIVLNLCRQCKGKLKHLSGYPNKWRDTSTSQLQQF